MEKDCKKCIHHIRGTCSAWECNFQTLEDYRDKVIDDFISRLENYQRDNFAAVLRQGITWGDIKIVAEQMKKGEKRYE